MPNSEKISAVAELTEQFSSAAAAVITEYRGLTVKQVTELRRALGSETTYSVVKNTLTKRAAADAGVSIADTLLTGPTAIAFIGGDPVEAAKGLRDFARTNPLLVIKGGVLDGKSLSPAEVAQIADLESREVLLAKLAGALKALPSRALGLFQAPLSQMARLAKALEEKKPVVEASAPPAEVSSAPDTTEVSSAPDTTEVSSAPDTTEVASAPDTTEVASAPDPTEVALAADAVESIGVGIESTATAAADEPTPSAADTAGDAAPEAPAEPAE